jgi:hypothetical protein
MLVLEVGASIWHAKCPAVVHFAVTAAKTSEKSVEHEELVMSFLVAGQTAELACMPKALRVPFFTDDKIWVRYLSQGGMNAGGDAPAPN